MQIAMVYKDSGWQGVFSVHDYCKGASSNPAEAAQYRRYLDSITNAYGTVDIWGERLPVVKTSVCSCAGFPTALSLHSSLAAST